MTIDFSDEELRVVKLALNQLRTVRKIDSADGVDIRSALAKLKERSSGEI